ncbi:MAG TPA: phosphate ABC transporter substrate-binding/OmpA family protein [Polyangiaceae bacterium]|nr:phosphate ABC transporter substrate-binding/OmpA family protein [Polyangiaceae bacterium]
MEKLTTLSKFLIAAIVAGSSVTAWRTYGGHAPPTAQPQAAKAAPVAAAPGSATKASGAARLPLPGRPLRVALSQWPGHMPLVVAAGGLTTQPGSPAHAAGLDLEIVFIEDAPSKNKALQNGEVDLVWQTVDELPISLGGYKALGIEVAAFLQIDWSRGGDACVASREVRKVEDVRGRKSAMLLFSPDHTVFEFMITNSRLTPAEVAEVRRTTQFSPDDFTFGRILFEQGKVDVACLWEPDVTLALANRPGSHRLFSTADATELVADVLVGKKQLFNEHPDVAEKLARVWFSAVAKAEADKPAAARLISTAASRFKDELGYEKTLAALSWAKWTDLADNVRFFGLDGNAPAFDRVYNQADSIWINYPQAEIKDRFAPLVLRDDRAVRKIWEAEGKPAALKTESYEPELARVGAAVFTKPVSINFGSGENTLAPEAIAIINQQVLPQLEIAKGMVVRIEGNTDSVGDRRDNQVLSELRAQAIVDYLVAKGVSPKRLVARGNGAGLPVAPNTTPEGRAQNRRTDILFIRRPK